MSRTNVAASSENSFLIDIKTLCERAHKRIKEGVVIGNYKANRKTVSRLLNEALMIELTYVLRYRRHHFIAKDINTELIAAEFLVYVNRRQIHADSIVARIVQLGGEPNFNPERLPTRSRPEYVEADSLVNMIKENLVTEWIMIDSYLEMICYIGDRGPAMRRALEQILAVKEEHTDELPSMLHDR